MAGQIKGSSSRVVWVGGSLELTNGREDVAEAWQGRAGLQGQVGWVCPCDPGSEGEGTEE